MPFVSTKENGGKRDPNISKKGRPLKGDEKTITRREAKDKELLSLARKLKPHLALGLKESVKILENAESADANKIRVTAFLYKTYHEILDDVYAPTREDEPQDEKPEVQEVQPDNRPVFSLRMLPVAEEKQD